MHPLPAAPDAHDGRVRRRQRRRRADVHRARRPGPTRTGWGCRSSARRASCSTSCSARSGSSARTCSSPTSLKCRPPDNRDPHPNEIEACQDYLRQQVELIEPTVICTLGNFSTKLLRADSTGISRLHGHEEVRDRSGRARSACTRSTTPPPRCTRPRRSRRCGPTSIGFPSSSRSARPSSRRRSRSYPRSSEPVADRRGRRAAGDGEPEPAAQLGLF